MNERIRVLYIDDEQANLLGFKATFRDRFDILTALSGAEATELLKTEPVHVILTDQRMPGMTGVEFCESIKDLYPHTVRMLVTAFADIGAVIKAINDGQVFRYLNKPWQEEDVEVAIRNGYEVYRKNADLEKAHADLSKAYSELNRFVYSASHDMRAPLMSILGIIKVARMDGIPESMTKYVDMIEESIRRLDGFNTSVIEYYKNGMGQVEIATFDLVELIQQTIEAMNYYPGFTDVTFHVQGEAPKPFAQDLFRMKVTLNNLLTNAIKFRNTNRDNNEIQVSVLPHHHGITMRITDNGVGIKEENLPRIFDMFFRGSSPNSGSGIGLYIVRESVEKMGGNIFVTSELGKQTTFELTLPNKYVGE